MTPSRFRECLRQIRWTSIDIVNALQCDVAFIESLDTGDATVPHDVAAWLEKLAGCHLENQPPVTCRSVVATVPPAIAGQGLVLG